MSEYEKCEKWKGPEKGNDKDKSQQTNKTGKIKIK